MGKISQTARKLQTFQGLSHSAAVRIAHHGILAHDEQTAQLAFFRSGEHLQGRQSRSVGKLCAPGLLKLLAGQLHLLIAAIKIGQSTHVAGSLHVLMPSQGAETRSLPADISRGQHQIGQRLDVIGSHGMLSNSHSVDDCSPLRRAKDSGCLFQITLFNSRDRLSPIGRAARNCLANRLKAIRPGIDKFLIVQALPNNDVQQGIYPGDVRPRPWASGADRRALPAASCADRPR